MKFKRFLQTASVFLAGNVLSKLVSFFLLPLYTSRIMPEQYGTYDLVMSLVNLIAPIAFFQAWDGMFRYAFNYQENEDKQACISNAISVTGFGVVIYFALFSLLHVFWHFQYFGYILLYGLLYAIQYFHTYAARVFLKNKLFVISGLVHTLTTVLLNVLLIVVFHWDIKALYVAGAIGCGLQILMIELKLGVFRKFRASKLDKGLIGQMLRFSLPLCVATVSFWLLSGFTKVLISGRLSTHANGLYAVANRFASMITLVVSVIQFAWNETAYLMANDDDRMTSYAACVDIMSKGVLFATAVLILLIKIIFPYFVNVQYAEALVLIPATIIGVGANSLASFWGTLFMTEKKTNFILVSTLIAAITNIAFGIVAVRYFGLMGAVCALAFAFVLLMVLRFVKLIRSYHLQCNVLELLVSCGALVFATIMFFVVKSNILLVAMCVALMILFLLTVRKYIAIIFHAFKSKSENA